MLVDMAGSENIDQAGQIGLEAKMQVECFEILLLYLLIMNCLHCISSPIHLKFCLSLMMSSTNACFCHDHRQQRSTREI